MFVMLDIKYRFTCDDSDRSEIIKKCQNIMTRIVGRHYEPHDGLKGTKRLNFQ